MQYPNEYPNATVVTTPSKPPRAVPAALFLATIVVSLVVGVLVGVVTTIQLEPKPVNPQTYTKPLQEQETYSRAVDIDYTGLLTSYDVMVNGCNTGTLTECEADAQTYQGWVTGFQSDLKGKIVPACLSGANGLLLTGLQQIQDAMAQYLNALKSSDRAAATNAISSANEAYGVVRQAMRQYRTVAC